jgi:class 3 adenylate cyclase
MYIGYHHRQHVTSCGDGWNQAFNQDCKLDLGWVGFHGDSNFPGYSEEPIEEHWDYLFARAAHPPTSLAFDMVQSLNNPPSVPYRCDEAPEDYWYIYLLDDMPRLWCPQDLRLEEQTVMMPQLVSVNRRPALQFVYDLRPWMLRSAVYNILQTIFICIILAIGAMVFSHDANVLVLQPIERMISKVAKIRDNPLYAMKLGDESYREKQEPEKEALELLRDKTKGKGLAALRNCWRKKDVKVQTLETKILENAIIKLGKLLALGFGEAGSEIIGKNMDDDSATVNAMIPGNKVEAVFGFCDIRNFTDTTEVLQDKVMVFVNQVAEIVHNIVDTWHGAANRNIGDAFLIVWRMGVDFTPDVKSKVGDMSVISFAQVVAAINKSAVLKDYREHPALLARLPNYRVRMGFGLHYGWAIEGAIGSEFKIDASYLSPHVNMASRLEAVTQQYKVLILMSEPLAQLCSPEMSPYFRTIDHVTLKGGMSAPIRLHTVDLNAESLKTDYVLPKKGKNPFELRMQREKAKAEKMQESFKVHTIFEKDPDLKKMRKDFPLRFFQLFSKGYLNYEAGEWDVARTVFQDTKKYLGVLDGPSEALLSFMSIYGYDASRVQPKGWPGYRELTET